MHDIQFYLIWKINKKVIFYAMLHHFLNFALFTLKIFKYFLGYVLVKSLFRELINLYIEGDEYTKRNQSGGGY